MTLRILNKKSYRKFSIYAAICSLLLAITYADISYGATYYDAITGNASKNQVDQVKTSIEKKREKTKKKIQELKWRENKEINKLHVSQQKLEKTKKQVKQTRNEYYQAKYKLNTLQSRHDKARYDYSIAEARAGDRIKQIYKGERINFLHAIFASDDINTFLDRLYYQDRMTEHDDELLDQMKSRASNLENIVNQVELQQNNILYVLKKIKRQKRTITNSINNSKYLMRKLRTDRATYESAEKELAAQSQKLTTFINSGYKADPNLVNTLTHFIKPIAGRISSPFGWRRHPIFKTRRFHSGIDIAGVNRSPIKASNSGKVIYSGWYAGYGKVVIIDHGKYKDIPTTTLYAHMNSTAVKVGDRVHVGQVVGYEGTTGYSTGPHLHFEVRLKGKPTNPMNFIK